MGVNFIKQFVAAGLNTGVPLFLYVSSADEDTI